MRAASTASSQWKFTSEEQSDNRDPVKAARGLLPDTGCCTARGHPSSDHNRCRDSANDRKGKSRASQKQAKVPNTSE